MDRQGTANPFQVGSIPIFLSSYTNRGSRDEKIFSLANALLGSMVEAARQSVALEDAGEIVRGMPHGTAAHVLVGIGV